MKSLPRAIGSYVLLVYLPKTINVQVGSLGERSFSAGYYAYVGSAMGGLIPRLRRHLKKTKAPRWHIDYLTKKGIISSIIISESALRVECIVAKALKPQFASVAGFGCSDCECESHLFFSPAMEEVRAAIERAFDFMGCPVRVLERQDIAAYVRLRQS
jgi:Uri superfamily endonuclease